MIGSFTSLNIGDVAGTKAPGVTSGISDALLSRATGLIVAIFTLIFANTFRGFYQRQLALIQEYGGQLELLYLYRCSYKSGWRRRLCPQWMKETNRYL